MEPSDEQAFLDDVQRRRTLAEELEEFDRALARLRASLVHEIRLLPLLGIAIAKTAVALVRRTLT